MFNVLGRALRSRTRLSSVTVAGTFLVTAGIGAGTLCSSRRVIRLDNEEKLKDNYVIYSSAGAQQSSLRRQKSLDKFAVHPRDVDRVLREHEQSHTVADTTPGISRFYTSQIASNNPTEDDHDEHLVAVPPVAWSLFSVFDGHSGWETSAFLRENLHIAIIGALADLYSKYGPEKRPLNAEVDDAIRGTFQDLDEEIVQESLDRVLSMKTPSKTEAIQTLAPAYAGACALLAFYDAESSLLRVALTGDVRAVLGRRRSDGKFDVHVLSADQNGSNPKEKERIEAAHPGEEVVKGDRVAGMGVSRAFGDALYKWGRAAQLRLKEEFLGKTPWPHILTPPYLTAEPVITTTKIHPGDFLILATDGLWECLSNEEAVGLVGLWMDDQEKGPQVIEREALPVTLNGNQLSVRYRQWRAGKQFVNVDENAATHLIRNAVGGADTDLTAALFSVTSPRSRYYLDDITTTVVFFSAEQ
ncbi:protein serine/threonine phosphatase 2C [Rickenella mellea]|uniref:Protein serine/threonine phosphatase 2C n=1 Tax=Rickenella mellea TaxID=50990 RepID=A0A4Y7PV19_9AGAM|nr:protein serine/threonine phosphatase 2C [Rickenella mellea]